jgi:membrane protein implicated in regulation of membrane protease activity
MKFLRDNGLTIALTLAFLLTLIGMALSGWSAHNEELAEHGRASIGLLAYLGSGDFISALFENWESEFLQMAAYVILTAYLFQRGSAESRDPDGGDEEEDRWRPLKAPGMSSVGRFFYAYSLGIALALLFVFSFVLHLSGSLDAANEEALLHGGEVKSVAAYIAEPRFWFESFQNWQSEFLSTAVLVVLSIFLRFRGSPESKPVNAPHEQTGS